MPIYEYECEACGHSLEALQKMSDVPLQDCPDCGQSTLRRLLSAPSFRLKGSGWYETDFKTGSKRNLAGDHGEKKSSGSEPKAEPKKDAESKTVKKPAAEAKSSSGKS